MVGGGRFDGLVSTARFLDQAVSFIDCILKPKIE